MILKKLYCPPSRARTFPHSSSLPTSPEILTKRCTFTMPQYNLLYTQGRGGGLLTPADPVAAHTELGERGNRPHCIHILLSIRGAAGFGVSERSDSLKMQSRLAKPWQVRRASQSVLSLESVCLIAQPKERCPPRQKSRVERLKAKVDPLLT